ncbi:DUF4440 domain-containing protein [Caulobacter segnis]|uniref:DUF4440 domain-containing protein n=1 Tax=Caulobacter segnis TaxID=88688 RepID=UPI00240F50DF|nr:DUF4440 domain-containing protein [Caulobacter segnis]MDG2521507.1 DUF4440 domain-containing protein [Caulobacter segnis]
MIRTLLAAAALSAAPLLAIAQTTSPAEVIAAERAFAADGFANGVKASFLRHMTDDALLFAPGPVNAKAFFEGRPDSKVQIKWWPIFAGIARSGDLGFTTGPAEYDGKRGGHYFTVWARQADGAWKWVYDGGPRATSVGQPGPESEPVALAMAVGGAGSAEKAFAQVQAAEAALAKAALTDSKAAFLAVLAKEARLTSSKAPLPATPEAVAAELDTRAKAISFAQKGGSASRAGDLAWTWGDADWTSADGKPAKGHYVRIWQTRPEGWRLVYDQILPA